MQRLGTRSGSGARATVVAASSSVLSALPAFLLGSLAVFIREDLRFDQARLGVAVASFFLASAAAAVPGGRLTERIGARLAMLGAAAVNGVAMLGLALTAGSWAQLIGWIMIAGAANGVAQPAGNLALARGVDNARQGTAFGLKQAAIPGATMLAGAAVPAIGLTVGWRWAFAAAAAGAVLLAVIMPSDPYRSERSRTRGHVREGDAPTGPLVVLAVGAACGASVGTSLAAFYVESAVASGLSPGPAGVQLALGSVVGIASRLAMGWLADRRDGHHLPVVGAMLTVGGLGFVGLALAAAGAGGLGWLLIVGTALSFGAGWGWPGLFNYAVVRLNPNAPAAATAITQTGVFVGGVVGPAGFGVIASSASFAAAWSVAAVLNVLAAACVILGRRMLRRRPDPSPPPAAGGRGRAQQTTSQAAR